MKARLVKDNRGDVKLLYLDGSFSFCSTPLLSNFLLNFKDIENFEGTDGNWRSSAADMALYSGETIAIVTDDLQLIIYSGDIFAGCFESTLRFDSYLTVDEYADMHGKTREIVKVYCRDGRLQGAQKKGNVWMIPKGAPYPVHSRNRRPKSCGPRPAEEEK